MQIIAAALDRAEDAPQSGAAEETVANALDIMSLLLGCAIGVVIGFVGAAILSGVFTRVLRRSPAGSALVKRIRTPLYWTCMTWGAWIGLQITLQDTDLSTWSNGALVAITSHGLLVLAIAGMTWIAYAAAWVFEDAARARLAIDQGRARRFETQAQVLRRLVQVIVVIIGLCVILGTFEAARQAMTTVLASAGLLSVVAGLAAQQTLGNVFAGVQLAFTDAIRVGDVVVVNDKGESGAIEEITLSYVVVRLWDERRLIVPSTHFTQTPFENWTRRASAQLGTVLIHLDWTAPMTLVRDRVEQILAATDLWDGRTWAVQVTDSDASTITVRILVSARNSGDLWDLRCHIREQLVSWVVSDEPWARPAVRIQPQETVSVPHDASRERMAVLAAELSAIAADPSAPGDEQDRETAVARADAAAAQADENPSDAAHAARLLAARRKAKRARRRTMEDRRRALAHASDEPTGTPADAQTQLMSETALAAALRDGPPVLLNPPADVPTGDLPVLQAPRQSSDEAAERTVTTTSGRGERIFSGSPDADERSEIYAGPGDEALAEREEIARRRNGETADTTDRTNEG
ncbi:mechanosensitive ion channel family protein [Actinomyces sp. B33]|uniref:mechanosensitive ion channel family protein n=1 Tax=Actinomyces sp. B33 TaxID=2942131 RepID=UPI002341B8E0|nr:mechanosensitive ion channel family protein [Actinomyces sp. B33]MDC4233482.1 mechanosensitive ion channel family protein [Actinomyces sp. B33]